MYKKRMLALGLFLLGLSVQSQEKILLGSGLEISVKEKPSGFEMDWVEKEEGNELTKVKFKLKSENKISPGPLVLEWKIPSINIQGAWSSNALFEKRLRTDWQTVQTQSRAAVEAPVITLFSQQGENIHTFAVSEAIRTAVLHAGVREENGYVYCLVKLFTERTAAFNNFEFELLLDFRTINYEESLKNVSNWWASFDELKPTHVPETARWPMYSTWYSYHQTMTEEELLDECERSYNMGYRTIIVDDGWQTLDASRGYAYTGDWKPDRFSDMADFVEKVHKTSMKIMLWYSVPFIGKHADNYKRFKGKFLTEDHSWGASILDPRYPEVRQFLIDTYVNALKDWKLDGFKLDFIDELHSYENTVLTAENGRDYGSVNLAVDRLMTDVITSLKAINPDILIEFRQRYVGPAMRKYGNMFRAADVPNDGVTNRVRITDVKLLCGNTPVHSDMLMWNNEEPVEVAALQLLNVLFSVPQMSVKLGDVPQSHQDMIRFYTTYWNDNQEVLLDGIFEAASPLTNYSVLASQKGDKKIIAVYDQNFIILPSGLNTINIINAKLSETIIISCNQDIGHYDYEVYDCLGNLKGKETIALKKGATQIEVPKSGMISLKRI